MGKKYNTEVAGLSQISAYLEAADTKEMYLISGDGDEWTVGCTEKCDLCIQQDPVNHIVSRHHASLYIIDGYLFVKDCSSNGTFIKDEEENVHFRVPKDTLVQLKDGQKVRFAQSEFIVHIV